MDIFSLINVFKIMAFYYLIYLYILIKTLLVTDPRTLSGNSNMLKWGIWWNIDDSKKSGPQSNFSIKNNIGFAKIIHE